MRMKPRAIVDEKWVKEIQEVANLANGAISILRDPVGSHDVKQMKLARAVLHLTSIRNRLGPLIVALSEAETT